MQLVKSGNSVWQITSLLLLTISVLLKLPFLFIISLMIFLSTDERLFLFAMLSSSLFENVFPSIIGFTVSSLVYFFCIIILINSILTNKKKIKHEFKLKIILFLWGLISIYGSLTSYTSQFLQNESNIKFILFNVFARFFLFVLIIYSPIVYKNPKEFLKKNSRFLQYIIFLFIVYFINNSEAWFGYSSISRNIITGTDPNEWSVLLITVLIFSFYDLNKQNKIVIGFLYFLVGFFIMKSVSRTGLICFGIFSAYLLLNLKFRFKFLFFILVTFLAIYYFENLTSDFIIRNQESKGLGTRLDLWQNTYDLVKKKPFFGNGLSLNLIRKYNDMKIQTNNVSHNSILDILTWIGIVGLLIYLTLFFTCINLKNFIKNKLSILLFLQFVAMMSLSWVYKDIVWVTLAISLIFKLHYNETITH